MTSTANANAATYVRIAPRRIGHGNFFVSNVNAAMNHYKEVFGLQVVFREPDIGAGFLSNGNSHHDVGLIEVPTKTLTGRDGQVQVPVDENRRPGLNHIGFEMESEAKLVAGYERALESGVEIHRTVDHTIARSVYLWDPDGYYLEFYADSQEDWEAVVAAQKDQLLTGNWKPDRVTASDVPLYVKDPEYRYVDGAPLQPHRASRAALYVRDLQRSLAFYEDVVGLNVVAGSPESGFAILAGTLGTWDLGLYQAPKDTTTPAMHHFSFEISGAQELEEVVDRLRGADVEIVKVLEHPTKNAVYVHDQDGILFEFYYPTSRDPGHLIPPREGAEYLL